MPIRLPAVTPSWTAEACVLACVLLSAAPAFAQVSGKPVSVDPGYCAEPFILDVFDGSTLVTWGVVGMHASLLDSTGVEAPGWPVNGVPISHPGRTAYVMAVVKLSEDAVGLVWSNKASGDFDGYVAWLHRTGNSLPTPADIVTDTVTARIGYQSVRCALRQDDSHAIVVLTDGSPGSQQGLIKQSGLPGAASTGWPSGGTVLADSISVIPIGACSDDSMGCYVLTMHQHNCSRPPPPTISPPCPADLKLFHLLPDGALDPAWPATGVLVTDVPGWDQAGRIVSDHHGGAYVVWYRSHPESLGVLVQHYGRDGLPQPGWATGGNQYPPVAFDIAPLIEGVTTSAAGDLVLLLSNYWQPFLLAVRPDGALVPGWPATGAFLAGGPSDGSYWYSAYFQIAVTPDDRIVFVGTKLKPGSVVGNDVWGAAFSMNGTVLPGWQTWGNPLCSLAGTQGESALALSGSGTFKVAWLDDRPVPPPPDTWPYVFFDHFAVSDATVPTLAAARLSGHVVEGRLLRATWWLSDGGTPDVLALRAVDDGEFGPCSSLERSGEHELTLLDSLPASFARVRYLLARPEVSGPRSISDTLVIQSPRGTAAFAVRCPSPQYGSALTLDFDSGIASEAIEVAVFDAAGRRVHAARLTHPGVGSSRLTLDLATARPGLYFIRVSDSAGRTAGARVIRLR